jgi:hypothetical protein
MSDFFDRLEHELRGAVVRAAPAAAGSDTNRSVRHLRVRSTVSGLVVGFGSIAAIAVAIIAIAVIGHGAHGKASPAQSSGGSACTRQLLGELGVLRRPQTRTDRAFVPPAFPTGSQASPNGNPGNALTTTTSTFSQFIVPGLTRLARTLPNGRRIFFVVYKPELDMSPGSGGDVVWVFITGPGTSSAAPADLVLPQLLSSRYQQNPPSENANVYFSVVPDGVARVVWTYPRVAVPRIKVPHGPVLPAHVIPGAKLTASVQGNVAAAIKPPHVGGLPSATTWFAADGSLIKTFRYPVSSPRFRTPRPGTTTTQTLTSTAVPASC